MTIDWNVIAAAVTALGGIIVGFIAARGKRREDTQVLIDQIQEERDLYVTLLREERAAAEARMDKMWADKAASREYVAQLRAAIHKGSPPPPPAPPAGYIE